MKKWRLDLLGYSAQAQRHSAESVCITGATLATGVQMHCLLENVVVDGSKVHVVLGGRPVEETPHQVEEAELPVLRPGAVTMQHPPEELPRQLPTNTAQSKFVYAVEKGDVSRYDIAVDTPVLLVARTDYANMCMMAGGWVNALIATRILLRPGEVPDVVFYDGHPQTSLDDVYDKLFGEVMWLKQRFGGRRVLFKRMLVPASEYTTPLVDMKHRMPQAHPNFVSMLREAMLTAYALEPDPPPNSMYQVLLLERRNYKAHPRSKGVVQRRMHDAVGTRDALASVHPNWNITLAAFEHLPFGEQLRYVHASDMFNAVHGAGNTHILFLRPGARVVEHRDPAHASNKRFAHFAQLAGCDYTLHQMHRSAERAKDEWDILAK